MRRREHEAAIELELNPQFVHHCRDEMYRLCSGKAPEEMIDCMKTHIPQIKGNECKEVSLRSFLVLSK